MTSRVQISVYNFLRLVYFLPFFAFITCICLTFIKDNAKATRTHCNVTNVLPSVSAMIAGFEPQRSIWRFCFAIDSLPRYLIAYLQLQRLLNRPHVAYLKAYRIIQIINTSIHYFELTFLLLVTYVSSNEDKRIHIFGFIGFVLCSLLYMLCTVLIDYFWRRTRSNCLNENERYCRSTRLKCLLTYVISLFISFYFFYRHNRFCEPHIYSMYCLFEYCVILTNIAFHSTIREEWDHRAGQIQFYY